ncbi:MAG: hypothetical protein Q7S55_00665 [Nanoarchaeota archaeon]|nr:hypothetical protein [Nanoarchaeota archaeon]
MKKKWLLAILLALPLVSAAGPLEVISGVWNKILSFGSLSFIGVSGLVPFTRILIWILTFALFFSVMSFLGAGGTSERKTFGFLKRNQAMVIAAVLATISAIFLPAAAILAVGTGWATAVGLILIGTPIVGLWYVLWNIPGKDEKGNSQETKGTVLLKLLISMLLFWILSAMNSSLVNERGVAIGQASVAGTMANFIAWALYIASIMIIYYIVKFFFVGGNNEEAEKKWQEGGEGMRKWFGKKMDAQKAREEIGRRAQGVREPKSYMINAVDACEGLINALYRSARTPEQRKAAVDKAEKHLKLLRNNLKRAVRSLRYLRRKEKGRVYEVFDNLFSHAGVALQAARSVSLPKPDSADWERELKVIHDQVTGHQGIRGVCGAIIKALDAFVESSSAEAEHSGEKRSDR